VPYTTTTKHALRALTGSSNVSDIDAGFLALAEDLDTIIATADTGVLASRPESSSGTAGKNGRWYRATNGGLAYDHGTGWIEVEPIVDTYANRPAGLNGQAGAVPGETTTFIASDKGPMVWRVIGGAWVLLHAVAPAVTSLPTSPVVGQECIFVAENGSFRLARWHLRYSTGPTGEGGATFLWAFLGGAPMRHEETTSGTTTSTTYADLGVGATAGPDLTAPLAGRYHISFGAHLDLNLATGLSQGRMSLAIGATVASDDRSAIIMQVGSAPGSRVHATPSWTHEFTIAAGTLLRGKYRTTNASNDLVAVNRWLEIVPLYIAP
jgi:hypothetical protein